MMSGRMNAAASDDYPFAAMQQQQQPQPPPHQPYLGFEHAGMGVGQRGHQAGAMMYDNFDFAAAAAAFGQFQQEAPHHHHHGMLALPPPPPGGAGGLMAPPPMPHGMQLQMPPLPMPMHGAEMYPALGMVKRESGGGTDAGRIGLNLGRRTYFSPGDMMAVDRMLMRSRLGGVFGLGFGGAHHQPPRCQAEGCKADLSGAKHYHRRHKVCEYHAKASLVAAGGKQQRFCQQCSRFHVLTEFDEAKRSCRKRLAEHNRRRRKPAASSNTAGSKDSGPPPKKHNAGAVSSSYTADNNNFSVAKSTISSNTSAISCLQQQDQSKVARPTALTLGAPPPLGKEDYQLNDLHLQAQADHHHRHQEQQHFITSLLHNSSNNNILSCSSVCSSVLPATANGEVSDQNNDNDNNNDCGGNNNNNGNMHLFEVDFM
uniref:Uncharacterized protein n=1 Tax=Avena sativa TaxID=4498 RepID=A0ACD6A6U3_AVESA